MPLINYLRRNYSKYAPCSTGLGTAPPETHLQLHLKVRNPRQQGNEPFDCFNRRHQFFADDGAKQETIPCQIIFVNQVPS